jgi:hypothetical protein
VSGLLAEAQRIMDNADKVLELFPVQSDTALAAA